MAVVRLKYIHRYRGENGEWRTQFRRKGCKTVTLPDPSHPTFLRKYHEALEDSAEVAPTPRAPAGSIGALIGDWYGSKGFKELKPSTQAVYRNIAERMRAKDGSKPVAKLETHHIDKMLADRAATPTAANRFLVIVRLLMQFAIMKKLRKDDPSLGVKRFKVKTGGFHTWSEEEISQYEQHWAIGTRERLALALLLYTGQRRGDVVLLGRQHIRNGVMELKQQKTGEEVWVPIHSELLQVLSAHRSDHLTFLTTAAGAPFTSNGFGNYFRDCCRAAGLPEQCSAHGLRKAACRRMAEAGCTEKQIAAISGHLTLAEVQRYTKAASKKKLAQAAMAAIEALPENKSAQESGSAENP